MPVDAALGALPHVAAEILGGAELGVEGSRWNGAAGDDQIEGSFMRVE